MKARASTVTMKIFRKVSIILSAIDYTLRVPARFNDNAQNVAHSQFLPFDAYHVKEAET
jgi:hypothetical protein